MERGGGPARLLEEPLGPRATTGPRAPSQQLFASADDAVTLKHQSQALQATEKHRKNLDRSLRQFLAGGLAGCAVRHAPLGASQFAYTQY
jgi:hypothetical protein